VSRSSKDVAAVLPHRTIFMEDIKLKEFVDRIWLKRKLILLTTAGFLLIGVLYINFSEEEYTATLKVLPENQQGSTGLLSQLGNIPGLNIGNQLANDNFLPPSLYPAIIQSNDFFLLLLDFQIKTKEDTITVRDFVASEYSPSLLGTIKRYTVGLPRLFSTSTGPVEDSRLENGITYLNGEDAKFKSWLSQRITAVTDNSTKILTISAESPDQLVAAQMANFTADYLKQYLDDYQTQKDVLHLAFIKERRDEAQEAYLKAQHELAIFRDRNRNVLSEVSRIKEEVLTQDFNLTNRIYSSLSEQYEQASIKSKEKRVLFKVLEGAQLPAPKSKPQTTLVIILSIFTGLIVSVIYVLFPIIFKEFYEQDSNGGSKVPV